MTRDVTFPWRAGVILLAPALAIFTAFWLLPLAALVQASIAPGPHTGAFAAYRTILANPRYLDSLLATIGLALATTVATLLLSTFAGLFLARRNFPAKRLMIALLTFPLVFPGVVVGFMVIMLAGRQGLIGTISMHLTGERWVFAYSLGGLFVGYLYFSIPRVIVTVMAAATKLDASLEEAARSLGASPWRIFMDVALPALMPALIAAGAVCFATAMGAFGTAFTLGTELQVLPMTIYTEFTLNADLATAAALSLMLGVVTWAVLAVQRKLTGTALAATV